MVTVSVGAHSSEPPPLFVAESPAEPDDLSARAHDEPIAGVDVVDATDLSAHAAGPSFGSRVTHRQAVTGYGNVYP